MEQPQNGAAPVVPSAEPTVQGVLPASSAIEGQFVVQTADTSAAPQGAPPAPTNDELVRSLQSEKDRIYAENLALQRQTEMLTQQMQQVLQTQRPAQAAPQNPYDPVNNPVQYIDWQNEQRFNQFAQTLPGQINQQFEQRLQGLIQQAQEQQFSSTHTDIPIAQVKAYCQSRGIAQLEDGYKLMTYDQRIQAAQRDTANNAINSFRQPQGNAPVRAASAPASAPNTYDLDSIIRAIDKDPSLVNRLEPAFRDRVMSEIAKMQQAIVSG